MADGDYVSSYEEVRRINHLDSSQVPDDELDQHIDQAEQEVESMCHTLFSATIPTFTTELFNTRNLYTGRWGSIWYGQDHEYGHLQSITLISYRSSEDSSWEDLDAGQNDDYVLDKEVDAVKFNTGLTRDGNQNLRISGTYGYTHANTPKKYKFLIALIAALQGIIYASGGSYTDVDSHSIGNVTVNRGQYAPNLKQEYTNITHKIERHIKAHGIRAERTSPDII